MWKKHCATQVLEYFPFIFILLGNNHNINNAKKNCLFVFPPLISDFSGSY